MKIAYVIDSLVLSGAQKHLTLLARGMNARGHTAIVFCLNNRIHPIRELELIAAGAHLHVIGKTRVAIGVAILDLAGAIRREKADVVVTLLFVSNIVGRLSARLAGVPAVACLQARNLDFNGFHRILLRMTARFNFCTVSNSRAAMAFAAEHEGIDLARCHYVPNAIDVPATLAPPPNWAGCGWPQLVGRRVIGSVGRLVPQKGYDILLAAFAPLAAKHPDLSLLLVGSGSPSTLAARASSLGLNGQVVFAGECPNVAALLPGLVLYVQPSRFEGMPNALMEAMAAKLKVVASRVDGNTELIKDGINGWLVPPGNPLALEMALIKALGASPGNEEIGNQARRTVIEQFSPTPMVDAYERILSQACFGRS